MDVKVLTFKVWAPYAHFRRPYTTRSPVTFTTPPRPTILGLLGAILGLSKKEYSEKLVDVKVGIRIESKIKKIRTTINLIDTKENKMVQRTQMLYEFISDPEYTFAVYTENEEIIKTLFHRISEGKPYYTPYLGTAQHIARVFSPKITRQSTVEKAKTNYVAPADTVNLEGSRKYVVERQAYHIDTERKATEYIDLAIPISDSITVIQTDSTIVTNEGIVLW